ncbi:glycosyltransferase family 2 protein [bacterium]|nr:glycosyltransferase family 2 protein [bacterium]
MKKLVIQIPCWNEEKSIAQTVSELPADLEGFDSVEIVVIDDGSTDQTVLEAKKAGVRHVVSLPVHQGLAAAFQTGLQYSLSLGASVVINTDADNQYCAAGIRDLVKPILLENVDLVIGNRHASKLSHLPRWKKILYRLAAGLVTGVTQQGAPDPTSGFRAMTRSFVLEISLSDRHSYTLETLLQAMLTGRKVRFVPVKTNLVHRPSRLIQSTAIYTLKTTRAVVFSLFTFAIKPKLHRILFPEKAVLERQD